MLNTLAHRSLQLAGKLLGRNKLSILIYHQVLAEPDPMRPSEPTAEVFEWQMRLLRDYFTPLSLDNALHHLKHNTLPANAVCVTFDDGYLNNLTVAEPILAKYAIPATVYVATGFSTGSNMWNDRLIHLFADPERQQLQLDTERVQLGDWQNRRSNAQQWLKKLKYLPLAQRLERIDGFYQQNNASEQAALMMRPEQIKQTAMMILSDFYYFKIADINLVFNRAKRGMFGDLYGSLDGMKVYQWFDRYASERAQAAFDDCVNEHLKIKEKRP
jgi:hypothetical protein